MIAVISILLVGCVATVSIRWPRSPRTAYIGAPRGETEIRRRDMLLIYGRESRIAEIDERPTGPEGSAKHVSAVSDQHEQDWAERSKDQDPTLDERSDS